MIREILEAGAYRIGCMSQVNQSIAVGEQLVGIAVEDWTQPSSVKA